MRWSRFDLFLFIFHTACHCPIVVSRITIKFWTCVSNLIPALMTKCKQNKRKYDHWSNGPIGQMPLNFLTVQSNSKNMCFQIFAIKLFLFALVAGQPAPDLQSDVFWWEHNTITTTMTTEQQGIWSKTGCQEINCQRGSCYRPIGFKFSYLFKMSDFFLCVLWLKQILLVQTKGTAALRQRWLCWGATKWPGHMLLQRLKPPSPDS